MKKPNVKQLKLDMLLICVLLIYGPVSSIAIDYSATVITVRFAVISDYGVAGTPERDVADLVKSWSPDLIITSGDNNCPSGAASTIDRNIGQYYHDFISPYIGVYGSESDKNQFFPSLGNHDWGSGNIGPYLDYFMLPENERYYDFVCGAVHFFALDSDTNEPDGTSSTSTQANWLHDRLASSTEPWKLVYFHHAPYSSGSLHGSSTWMQWPFEQWGATAIFSGHDHHYERLLVHGLLYFVNGLGGQGIRGFGTILPESQVRYNGDYGAMLVEADNDSINFRFFSRTGSAIDEYTLTLPQVPTSLVANAVSSSQVNLSWNDNANNEEGFKIERTTSLGEPWNQITAIGSNTTSYQDIALTPFTTYYYRVCAFNLAGDSSYSNTANATTTSISDFLATFDSKTDPGGVAWTSGNYLLAAQMNEILSSGPHGDQSTSSLSFTSTKESLIVTLNSADKLLLIGSSQLWNNNLSIGSSICIYRNSTRISADMFTIGASVYHRHLATVEVIDSPGAGIFNYTLRFKTDSGGRAWASGTYLIATKNSDSWTSGPIGDQSTTSTIFTSTGRSVSMTLMSGDKLLLVASSQLWNSNPLIGSSICISRSSTRISGDMFTVGASKTHRHLATALATDSPGVGTFTYTLDYKTDSGGTASASGTYLLAIKISNSWSSGPSGDQSTNLTSFTPTSEDLNLNYESGDKFLLIESSQCWNNNPSIGSSICISCDGSRISGDMFAIGATITHRHHATAIAVLAFP